MSSKYKLYYFNVSGLAEPIRYLLCYCKIEFDDIRINQDWERKYKKVMPMEQVPVLEIDGEKYHQHKSICRYIARNYNLYGSSDIDSLKIDAFIDDIDDLRSAIGNYYKEEDPDFKSQLKERVLEMMPFYLKKFELQLIKNNGYFFNSQISWPDIYYAGICTIMSHILEYDINQIYPNLTMLIQNIRNIKEIKEYLENRPNISF